MNKKYFKLIVIVSAFLTSILLNNSSVSATDYSKIYVRKALLEGVYQCYTNGNIRSNVGSVAEYSWDKFIKTTGGEDGVKLPTGLTSINDNGVNCGQLFYGYNNAGGWGNYAYGFMGSTGNNTFEGVFALAGQKEHIPQEGASDINKTNTFLKNMGYEVTEQSPSGKCIAFNFSVATDWTGGGYGPSSQQQTQSLCVKKINSNGAIDVDKLEILGDQNIIGFNISSAGAVTVKCNVLPGITKNKCGKHEFSKGETKWEDFANEITEDISTNAAKMTTVFADQNAYISTMYQYTPGSSRTDYGETASEFSFSNAATAANHAIAFYLGGPVAGLTYSNLAYTPNEEFTLYQNYLVNYYGADIQCDVPNEAEYGSYKKIKVYKDGAFNDNCLAIPTKNAGQSVNGIKSDGHFGLSMTFEEMAKAMLDSEATDIVDDEIADITTSDGAVESEPDQPQGSDPCYNAGVDGMSWILCPAINNMAGAVDGIDKLLRDWLSVDPGWIDNSSGAYVAWGYCRDVANLLLVVVLIAVIISQITGYGIDNYGIKKILPRLIAIAILVNLSFIICQLLSDLSNILGTSLDKMFQGIGRTIDSGLSAGKLVAGVIAIFFGALAGAGMLSGTAITIVGLASGGGGVMLVISLVLILLIALVSIMMFFLMLGARMMIIIVFSALSPIAFACYVLPNTQKWFKKWWDIYKTALIMYPICGALYGISYVIRGIVFGGTEWDLWMALIGICAPFIPFLILPTLLKGALSALGAVGNSIMSLGSGVKKGISKGNDTLRNTAAYQQAQEFNRNKLAEKRANRTISRLGSIESSGGKLTNSQRNRLYKARMTANDAMMRNETEKAGVTMIDQSTAEMRAKATRQAQETKLWSDQFARADSKTIETAFIDALSSGKSEDVAKASAAFSALKDTGNLPKIHSALTNANWKNMSSDMRLSLNQDMIKSGDVAMKTYARRSFAADNQGSFAEFMAGKTQTFNTSSGTRTIGGVGEELAQIGPHALDGQDKDSVEFLADHMDGLINNVASNPETRGSIAKMIISGATTTQSGEEKKRFAEMIAQYKYSFNGDQAAYEQAISEAVSAAQLAKLDSSIYNALGSDVIRDATTGKLRFGDPHSDQVNRMLSGAIAEIKKDNNATLYAGMSNAVKAAINEQAAPPIPTPPSTPPAP